ncbi:MAG: translation initiation factor IF-2, partial [Candidatus Hydrogenedentes bacterium]|nr:translation initiation factor IF-2 [Candidatus Hydrogenedentota bacterium]
MGIGVNDLILDLMDLNILANKNQGLGFETIHELAERHGFEAEAVIPEETAALEEEPDEPEDLVARAPVVTVMGHVDHGKTTLLDTVRSANVVAGEAGGITQHIAAYDVPIKDGRVVFLDTPGHEAFTQMRARGAKITDVVVLVVAADDGVMPQTIEAIDHAKAAEVPIVVAINKCDKPDAQPDRIRQELTAYGLLDQQWGGKTVMQNISAKAKQGVDDLMELLWMEAVLLELKANPKKRARGAVIESEITRGMGPVAWVLVQNGTLRVGDVFLAGESYGRVRTLNNARGESIQEAGPSTPVVVTGFNAPPAAGTAFVVLKDERVARAIAEKRADLNKQKQGP